MWGGENVKSFVADQQWEQVAIVVVALFWGVMDAAGVPALLRCATHLEPPL